MLSVANVGTLLGGTGAAAYTVVKSLPDWKHTVLFLSGFDTSLGEKFGCDVRFDSRLKPELLDDVKPDVILFHNTMPDRMPLNFRDGVLAVYYQHSGALACRDARKRCHGFLTVSKWLAGKTGVRDEFVLYQPVPKPAEMPLADHGGRNVFGRIATPGNRRKWDDAVDFYVALYEAIGEYQSRVAFEFIGCPDDVAAELHSILPCPTVFHKPSWEARSRLTAWDAMLYHSDLEESYGRTVCEAQRAGCVPIVDRRGGFTEQIRHGETGFLCESIEQFADAIRSVASGSCSVTREALTTAGDQRGGLAVWRRQFLKWLDAFAESRR